VVGNDGMKLGKAIKINCAKLAQLQTSLMENLSSSSFIDWVFELDDITYMLQVEAEMLMTVIE
jgi:hypothetical protein